MTLESFIWQQRQAKDILLMSHTVLGYPSWDDNRRAIAALVEAGVELIELQFPFSEAIADGPVLLAANHQAIHNGVSTQSCFEFAADITRRYPQVRFVVMTYVNILFKYGVEKFVTMAAHCGLAGCIIPDLPAEAAEPYLKVARDCAIATIFLVTPDTQPQRIQQIVEQASGLVYCVARRGVTGKQTQFSEHITDYLHRVRSVAALPIAVGFGIQSANDVQQLVGQTDIAVVGSEAVRQHVDHGADRLGQFMQSLRPERGVYAYPS